MKPSYGMTFDELMQIVDTINTNHSFGNINHRNWVKYIRPHIDTRDGLCFHIKLDDKVFNRDTKQSDSMFDDIMAYLTRE